MPKFKKIILVITNSRGVSEAFVTDDFQYLLLDEALILVKRGVLAGVHFVKGKNGAYLRSNHNTAIEDNLDTLSLPAGRLFEAIKEHDEDGRVTAYAKAYGKFLELRFRRDELLYLDGIAQIPKKEVLQRLRPLASAIKEIAARYDVDPYLLGAILIDELARMGPDDLLDILGKLGARDTTVGLAQVKLSTARDMIKKKLYPADLDISQSRLYDLLTDDKASVRFAAAYLSFIKKLRAKKNKGTTAAEVASCYSRGKFLDPPDSRGKQIARKLRDFAKEIFD
jgi:soluble lytic murein transglycosylase-like protein